MSTRDAPSAEADQKVPDTVGTLRKSKRHSQSTNRAIRWAGYTKDHVCMTFENVPLKFQPTMFENRHGLAIYLEKIDGWRLPKSVFGQLGQGKVHLSLQLSLSLFHLTSGTFFGTTWMGPRISLSDPEKAYSKDVELQFKEMIYLISRINDETCVGVVEIVVGKENDDMNLTAGQYGCGWTMLNIFNKTIPPDCADRREDVKLMSCPVFAGSPRDLVMNPNIDKLAKSLKEIPDCYLFFKVYSHRRLLKLQRHVAENEVIGRYDAIPGLLYRDVVPPNHTRGMLIPCIGDEEVVQRDGIHSFPAKPKMIMYSTLKIADSQLYLPRRDAVEVRMIESVLSIFPKDKQKEVKVLNRYFKYGLHNGHSILGELQSQQLIEDPEDRDILLTQDPVLTVYGYAPDECMGLVCSIEYLIGIPAPKIERTDPKELVRTSQHLDTRPLMSTSVALGCAVYVPSDGYRLHLKNVKPPPPGSTEEGLNIELSLERSEVCKFIATVPLANLKDPSNALVSLAAEDKTTDDLRRSLAAKSIANAAKGDRDSKRVLDTINQKENNNNNNRDSMNKMFSVNTSTLSLPAFDKDSIPILGFDLKVLHPKQGELRHEEEIRNLLTMMEKDTTPLLGGEDASTLPVPDDAVGEKRTKKDAKGGDSDEEKHTDDGDSSPSRSIRRRGGAVVVGKERSSRHRRRGDDDDDDSSVADSLVSGDSFRNGLRIDPFFYAGNGIVAKPLSKPQDERSRIDSDSFSTEDRLPRGDQQYHRRSQLAQRLLHAKFTPRRVDAMMNLADDVLSSRQLDRQVSQQDIYLARKTTVPMMRNDFFLRTISRGAKSRLNRYGIQDAMRDTALVPGENLPPQFQHLQMTHGGRGAVGRLLQQQGATDLELEARDELSVHEVSLQFAGFRYGPPPDSNTIGKSPAILSVPETLSNSSTAETPRAVYFSYQFFTCAPTRTEAMRLSPAAKGEISVLIRDTPSGARSDRYEEPALVLRYIIDCSTSSPFEAVEFAEYLSHKSLYIDVWDADSLLPIGTFGIPLRMLMRQGALCVKHAVECDVINYETVAPVHGGITSLTIMEGGPISGELVGSVQMIISNYGIRGKGKHRPASRPMVPIEGLNWRMHHEDIAMALNGGRMHPSMKGDTQLRRPKTSVMARPLSATAPDLQKALQDLRDSNGVAGPPVSYRSLLLQGRDHGGGLVSTLNYDEVVLLFRRFQGIKKGTVQYAGPLLQLMDLPSSVIVTKKIVKLFKLYGDSLAFRNALLQHANSAEYMKTEDIEECFRVMSDRCGLKFKPEERTLLARKLLVNKSDQVVSVTDVMNYISAEADRLDWVLVSQRLRHCAQKAELDGHDVEQMLAEYDSEGKHHISTRSFRDFLIALSKFGKLTQHDIHVTCRFFARHGRALDDRDPVSLSEVMATFGKNYVGNLQARIRKIIAQQTNGESPLEVKYVLRLLMNADGANALPGTAIQPGQFTYTQVEQAFRSLGVFTELSHPQVKYILSKMDVRGAGLISASQVLTYLGIPYRASDLPSQSSSSYNNNNGDYSYDYEQYAANPAGPVIDTEYILKLLLQKAQSNGVQIDQAFRHFDTNGDGQISREELITGMQKLELFEGVPNWQQQIPGIVKKFDSSGDGLVSLKEFFTFLGIQDYAPNIIQRLTKIFSVATDKGLSFQAIFQELDSDKTGTIDAKELEDGLKKLGTFESVAPSDIAAVIKQFDQNGDNKIAMNEFITFFSQRVAQDKIVRKQKHALKIAKRFREVMRVAQSKGATLEMIFSHLDKDKGGSVSTMELAEALSKMPNFKSISRDDILDLLSAIDKDNSGDVTLQEFELFVNNANDGAAEFIPPKDIVHLIRDTFGAAISKGLSVEKEFALVDRDRSGKISLAELESIVRKLPSFRDISAKDMQRVFDAVDVDRSGMITADEFSEFVRTGQVSFARTKQRVEESKQDRKEKMGESKAPFKDTTAAEDAGNDTVKEKFIRHMRRISDIDGSIRALLAFLDDDEDGLIVKRRLMNLLRREGVFENVDEHDINAILKPFEHRRSSSSSGNRDGYDSKENDPYSRTNRDTTISGDEELYLEVVPLLTFLEQRKYQPRMVGDAAEDDALLEKELTQEKEYVFSKDPEICSLERKLRSFGRILAKQGVDVEQEFQTYDVKNSGLVMRTEFVKVLGKLGMFLLEEGKVLKEQQSGDPNDIVRQRQVQQIKQIKGADGMYIRQAPNLARKMFHNMQDRGQAPPSSEFKNHLESLTIIDWYRQGQKQHLIQNVLSHSLAHTIHLYPRFGKTLFFEYPITNPFGHEERFILEIPDGEMRLITKVDEWLYCRKYLRPCVGELGSEPIESDLFDKDPMTGQVSITLLPHETLYVPFTFMTLIPFRPPTKTQVSMIHAHTTELRLHDRSANEDYKDGNEAKDDNDIPAEEDEIDALLQRVISTKIISASHGHIVAILKVIVCPRPFVVDRVIRLYEYEHSIAKRKVKLVGLTSSQSGMEGDALYPKTGDFVTSMKFLHCVESTNDSNSSTRTPQEQARVVVEWGSQLRNLSQNNPMYHKDNEYLPHTGSRNNTMQHYEAEDMHALDLLIRYRVAEAPQCGVFHLLVYDDPYQCHLHEVWQVMVHARLRLDVHGTVGAVSAADLVIRGDHYPRRIRAYSLPSPFFSLSFKPQSTMQMVPNAYNRILTCIQPKISGNQRRALIHVVDVDSLKLMAGYLVSISAGIPAVMRTYDVEVPVNKAVYKKILFTNPWDSRRRYVLTSSDEEVMRPRGGNVVEVGPGGTAYFRLWFTGWRGGDVGVKEVHLFLNDAENGGSEEAHLFRVMEASVY